MDEIATKSLTLWDLPGLVLARLVNVAENHTYLVESDSGFKSVLRIHRRGYHTEQAIRSELHWLKALAASGTVNVPAVIPGKDGEDVQTLEPADGQEPRNLVMFAHITGHHPQESGDLAAGFETLGRIAALTHLHSLEWQRPAGFFRPAWDLDAILGPAPRWGNWRHAPNATLAICKQLERAEDKVIARLRRFGAGSDRFGLIHADMRLANLIVSNGETWLIDFDDCAPSWFLYDFAAGISFIEDHPQVPDFKRAWIEGYSKVRRLGRKDLLEMGTFVMLRRLALLAWVGSRIESTEPQRLAPFFASATADLAEKFLSGDL